MRLSGSTVDLKILHIAMCPLDSVVDLVVVSYHVSRSRSWDLAKFRAWSLKP